MTGFTTSARAHIRESKLISSLFCLCISQPPYFIEELKSVAGERGGRGRDLEIAWKMCRALRNEVENVQERRSFGLRCFPSSGVSVKHLYQNSAEPRQTPLLAERCRIECASRGWFTIFICQDWAVTHQVSVRHQSSSLQTSPPHTGTCNKRHILLARRVFLWDTLHPWMTDFNSHKSSDNNSLSRASWTEYFLLFFLPVHQTASLIPLLELLYRPGVGCFATSPL